MNDKATKYIMKKACFLDIKSNITDAAQCFDLKKKNK